MDGKEIIMNDPLRVGVIGCGVIGPTHVESYQKLPGVEVAWVCDVVREKAERLAEKYGVENITEDFNEVLSDSDVNIISVCTDHASHAPISVAALDAGKHVLCEKALAASREGLSDMMAAHKRHPDLRFGGVFQHRFDPPLRYLRKLVQDGAFGTILTGCVQVRCKRTKDYYRADRWRGTWAEEGGAVLINQAIHFIDSLLWIMDGATHIAGQFENLTHGDVIETEDTAVAAVRFKSGALGTIEATCSSHMKWETTISVHGSDGSVDFRGPGPLKVDFKDPEKQTMVEEGFANCESPREINASASHYGFSHPAQIADFVDAVREGRDPFVTAESARHAVDVVLSVYESHHKGGWVPVSGKDA